MEGLLPTLASFTDWLLRSSWQASVLIALVLLVQWVFRKQLAPRWRYALWLLVLIRLALPAAPESPFSVFNLATGGWAKGSSPVAQTSDIQPLISTAPALERTSPSQDPQPTNAQQNSAIASASPITNHEANLAVRSPPASGTTITSRPANSSAVNTPLILSILWLFGALLFAAFTFWFPLRLNRQLANQHSLVNPAVREVLGDCQRVMRVRRVLPVVQSRAVHGPALMGFIRPWLLLPEGMLEKFTPEELRFVFLHELAHLKRSDIAVNWLMTFLLILHWFNPLVWFAFARMRADRELACDALALSYANEREAKSYGQTILKLLDGFARPAVVAGLVGILEDPRELRSRIAMIAQFKKSSGWPVLAVALVALLGCVSLTDAPKDGAPADAAGRTSRARSLGVSGSVPRQLRVDDAEFWFNIAGAQNVRAFDISPDGQRIVFAGDRTKPRGGLMMWDAKTSITSPLNLGIDAAWPSFQGSRIPRWAPDGRHLMAQGGRRVGEDATLERFVSMFRVDTETGTMEKIGSELPWADKAIDMCWLPDGQGVTYFDYTRRFYTLSLSGERKLWAATDLPGDNVEHEAALGGYSADGRWLLVSLRGDLWLMPHLGGRAAQLTQRPGVEVYPTWGPDGKSVYFVSAGESRRDTAGLWKIAIDPATGAPRGTAQELFKKPGQKLFYPKFVAGGRRLMYAVDEPKTEVWIARADQMEKATPVIRGQEPVLSPDGQTIYFRGETVEQQGIFAIDRAGKGVPRKLCDIATFYTTQGSLASSPDGELLAMSGYVRGKHGLYTIPSAGGTPLLLAELPDRNWIFPAWSPDGQWLAYAVEQGLHRVSRDGKIRETLATLYQWQAFTVEWSPDGKHISALGYETRKDWEEDARIAGWVVAVADKKLRKVTPDNEPWYKEGLQWHPDGQRLTYFLYFGPNEIGAKHKLAFLDGRPTEEIIDQTDHWDYLGVWTPDGRQFYFESEDCKKDGKLIHRYDQQTKQITHGVRSGSLPIWSRDGRTVAWVESELLRNFEVLEHFR